MPPNSITAKKAERGLAGGESAYSHIHTMKPGREGKYITSEVVLFAAVTHHNSFFLSLSEVSFKSLEWTSFIPSFVSHYPTFPVTFSRFAPGYPGGVDRHLGPVRYVG